MIWFKLTRVKIPIKKEPVLRDTQKQHLPIIVILYLLSHEIITIIQNRIKTFESFIFEMLFLDSTRRRYLFLCTVSSNAQDFWMETDDEGFHPFFNKNNNIQFHHLILSWSLYDPIICILISSSFLEFFFSVLLWYFIDSSFYLFYLSYQKRNI